MRDAPLARARMVAFGKERLQPDIGVCKEGCIDLTALSGLPTMGGKDEGGSWF